jgi:Bacterial membrane protein YfhO
VDPLRIDAGRGGGLGSRVRVTTSRVARTGGGIRARLTTRPALAAALVYAALAILLVSPALLPGRTLSASDAFWTSTPWTAYRGHVQGLGANTQLSDSYILFQPFLQYTRSVLPHVPLWDPYLMAGRPYLANAQSAIFSPFSLPAYVLPFWRSLAVIAVLKLFVAAFGTYLLARALSMRFAAALFAGVVFGFSLWFVSWLAWHTTTTWALLPWLWLMADAVVRRPGLLPTCGLATVVGLQFLGGHPESNFQVVVLTTLFFALRLVERRRGVDRPPPALRQVAAFGGAVLLGAALAGLTLIPLFELLSNSADHSRRSNFGHIHSPATYLLGIFLPHYWGRPTGAQTNPLGTPFLHTRAYYVGALPLMLAATALLTRRNLQRLGLATLAVVCVAVVVGTPGVSDLVAALPVFDVANNARFVIGFTLAVALLAGWGLDDLLDRETRPATGRILALCALLLVAPIVWMIAAGQAPQASVLRHALRVAWGFAEPTHLGFGATPAQIHRVAAEIRLAALLEWLVLAGAALLLLIARLTGRLRPAPFAALAVLLAAADLFRAGMGINPAIRTADAQQPVTPALRYLQAHSPERSAGVRSSGTNPLPPNLALRYRVQDVRGYEFPVERRYFHFWEREFAPDRCNYFFCFSGVEATPTTIRGLSLMSVSNLLTSPTGPDIRLPGLRLVYRGPDARIYENRAALPRAFVVDRQVLAPGADRALDAVTAPGFDAEAEAVTEARVRGVAEGASAARAPAGSARIASYAPEHVRIDARARRTSILVLTDTYFPGWKATVDGADAPIERVNYLFRGVRLPPGAHRVELRYEPASWRAGRIVSALALIVLLGLTALGLRRRRAAVRPPT